MRTSNRLPVFSSPILSTSLVAEFTRTTVAVLTSSGSTGRSWKCVVVGNTGSVVAGGTLSLPSDVLSGVLTCGVVSSIVDVLSGSDNGVVAGGFAFRLPLRRGGRIRARRAHGDHDQIFNDVLLL